MAFNVVDNTTDVREMRWAVNGRDGSDTISMKGWRCKTECDHLEEVEAGEGQLSVLWSEATTWPNLPGRIPLEGEEVEIMKGMVVIYDIGVSPRLKSLEVNGKLSFLRGQPAQLNTYSMWVRAGQVDIGTEEEPFDSTVEIRLHGNNTSPSQFVFSQSVPVGNKNLIITGTMNMFGLPRTRMTRLLMNAMPGQT